MAHMTIVAAMAAASETPIESMKSVPRSVLPATEPPSAHFPSLAFQNPAGEKENDCSPMNEADSCAAERKRFAQTLFDQGVVVVPMFTQEETNRYHQEWIDQLLHHTPELMHPHLEETTPPDNKAKKKNQKRKSTQENTTFVDGGFGALALASSFHNPVARNLRTEFSRRTRPLFAELDRLIAASQGRVAGKHLRVEQLVDRFCIRRAGSSTTAESWHRDQSPAWEGDVVLGGWVNLDLTNGVQKFSCHPATHRMAQGQTGFAPLTPAQSKKAKENKTIVEIPPGHHVMFYQNLVHEVFPTKSLYDSMRQFVGFRLTKSTRSFFDDVLSDKSVQKEFKGTEMDVQTSKKPKLESPWSTLFFEHQGVPPIPSGQRPPMYPKMSLCFRKPKLLTWAQTLHPSLRKEDGLPLRYCPSLQELGARFPPYTAQERQLHQPNAL